MTVPASSKSGPRRLIGLLVIALGMLLLADNLGWFDARGLLRLVWPLVVVGLGVGLVRSAPDKRTNGWGWVLILLGLWLFLDQLGWIRLTLSQVLLPGVLLFVGGMLVLRSLTGTPRQSPSDPRHASADHGLSGDDRGPASGVHGQADADFSTDPASASDAQAAAAAQGWQAAGAAGPAQQAHAGTASADFVTCLSVLSVSELRPVAAPFSGANLNAVLGGIRLDLGSARLQGDTVTVEVFVLMGQVQILVPSHWVVRSQVGAVLAGHAQRRQSTAAAPAPTLILKGAVVMGRLDVTDSPASGNA